MCWHKEITPGEYSCASPLYPTHSAICLIEITESEERLVAAEKHTVTIRPSSRQKSKLVEFFA